MEEVKENKKVLYYFAIFAIVNELLIIKNRRAVSLASSLMQARDEMRSSSDRGCEARRELLQTAMTTHERHITLCMCVCVLDPRSEL